jgi:hypothetical protein
VVGRTYDQEVIAEGDIICFLQGGYSPLILAPRDEQFEFIGSCVLYGHNENNIQAEALTQGPFRVFNIV